MVVSSSITVTGLLSCNGTAIDSLHTVRSFLFAEDSRQLPGQTAFQLIMLPTNGMAVENGTEFQKSVLVP
eukprot:g61308.t1